MRQIFPDHDLGPHAEQLREAMGWDRFPILTAEERKRFDDDNARAQEAARKFHRGNGP